MKNLSIQLVLAVFGIAGAYSNLIASEVKVAEHGDVVTIENAFVKLNYDLSKGKYNAVDRRDGSTCIKDAFIQLDDFASNNPDYRHEWESKAVTDELGKGRRLLIKSRGAGLASLLFEVSLYDGGGYIVLAAGIENTTGQSIQLKHIKPVAGATAFEGFDITKNFTMLDGNGGGEHTAVSHGNYLHSRNNLLVTFGTAGDKRSLVLGGLTYHDFEKFAEVGQLRRTELENSTNGKRPLLCYLDLPPGKAGGGKNQPTLRLIHGKDYTFGGVGSTWGPEFATIVFDEKEVVLEATGLDVNKSYQLGFSWWDVDNNGRIQSVSVDGGAGTEKQVVLAKQLLPAWRTKQQGPEEVELSIPARAYASGRMRIIFSNETDVPNAVVSEVWLREGAGTARMVRKPISRRRGFFPRKLRIQLYAADPVGKRVEPGVRYLPKDRFYLDFMTDNPFDALEKYGLSIRAAQKIKLNIYDFPTVCLWYSHHPGYGGGPAYNDTLGAVEEMERIIKSGFLRYSRAAVRLVPDCYNMNNQQGWWDDKHWQMHGSTNIPFEGGTYKKPYETTVKWGKAMAQRGGIALTYFQTSFRSEDYAEEFEEHMLFNKSHAWKRRGVERAPDDNDFWGNAWRRNGVLWGYDYTDPGFIRHMRQVYSNLRAGGVKGLMFDYPASGWAKNGGMEGRYATTAMAYRNIFKLAYEGLGPDCYIHERNIQRGSDISLGLVASQRIWGDTDRITAEMVTRGGLRWYKNRVVVNYDMDAKNLRRARPKNRDGVRRLLTMAYVTSGRLLLGNSFAKMSQDMLYDLSRVYPFHAAPQSARPLDAFTQKIPRIYDFKVNSQWHQLTFYNPENEKEMQIAVELAGDTAFGALGLDPTRYYYVYDFWNDRLIGKVSGSARLQQQLRAGEARMMSIHEAANHPQFISTNRHVMQGYVDIVQTQWLAAKKQLIGTSKVIGGETYKVIIAANGYHAKTATTTGGLGKVRLRSIEDGLVELSIDGVENAVVNWVVTFAFGGSSR